MGEEAAAPAVVDINESSSSPKPWHSYISDDLPRTVQESTDSALRSARSFQNSSSIHFHTLQDFVPKIKVQYRIYSDVFVGKIKDELAIAIEHPAMAGGIGIAAGLLILRGPRRFLFRQTLGRFQSEEAKFGKAEKNVKGLSLSVDIMKKESKKLLERVALAEKEMKRGQSDLMDAGNQIRSVAKSVYKVEAEASDLMDVLRETPGREAIKLRAEVASMASHLRQQRTAIGKRIVKLSELGVPI